MRCPANQFFSLKYSARVIFGALGLLDHGRSWGIDMAQVRTRREDLCNGKTSGILATPLDPPVRRTSRYRINDQDATLMSRLIVRGWNICQSHPLIWNLVQTVSDHLPATTTGSDRVWYLKLTA